MLIYLPIVSAVNPAVNPAADLNNYTGTVRSALHLHQQLLIDIDVDTHSEGNSCETDSETGSESEMVSSLGHSTKKRGREASAWSVHRSCIVRAS